MDRMISQELLSHQQEGMLHTAGLNMVLSASKHLHILCATCPVGMTWEGVGTLVIYSGQVLP